MRTINASLLRRTMAYLEEHPDELYSEVWVALTPCGTVRCIAGTVAHLAGYKFRYKNWNAFLVDSDTSRNQIEIDLLEIQCSACRTTSGEFISVVARQELGLDHYAAARLFDPKNKLSDLRSIVADLIEQAEREGATS